jgi:hypothetical protein
MIDGGEIIVKKVRAVGKVLPPVGPTANASPLVKTKAKVGKANLNGKANLLALPWATAAPNPAATVGKLDMSIETVENACGMKNRANRKRNPHTTTTPNMRLTFRWMRPP